MTRTRKNLLCDYCPGRHSCFLHESLDKETHAELTNRRNTFEFQKGETLYRAGDRPRGIWVVCSGHVKTYFLTEDGKALIGTMAGPGDILAHGDVLSGRPHREYAEALSTATMSLLDAEMFQKIVSNNSEFAQHLLRKLAQELHGAQEMAVKIAYRPARDRVLDVLGEFNDQANELAPASPHPVVAARRQEIAERAGLTVETTVRMLKQMEKEGKLAITGRRIEIRNRLREPVRAYA